MLGQRYDLELVHTPEGYFIKDPYLKYYGVVHNWRLRVPHELDHIPITTIPPEHYYMLGDYRDNSTDSRFFGAVPRSWIYSKVIYIFHHPLDWLTLLQIKEADETHSKVVTECGVAQVMIELCFEGVGGDDRGHG